MRVGMCQPRVSVPVENEVRLGGSNGVLVLVVLAVIVEVFVFQPLMDVLVFMINGDLYLQISRISRTGCPSISTLRPCIGDVPTAKIR
jgi:hypothetical protein